MKMKLDLSLSRHLMKNVNLQGKQMKIFKDCENEKPEEFKSAKRQRRKSRGQGSSPDKDEDKFMQFMIESREKDQEMFSKIMELIEKADQRSAEVTLQLVQAIGEMVQNSKG